MHKRTSVPALMLLALLGQAQAQEGQQVGLAGGAESSTENGLEGGVEGDVESRVERAGPGAAAGWPDSPEALLERFDVDGDARLDLGELGDLYSLYFSPDLSAGKANVPAVIEVAELRQYAGKALAEVVKENPEILTGALIVDEDGREMGRITRLVVDREKGVYHAVIPAGKLVELIGFESMVIPLSHLQIREDVLLLDDVDAVIPLEEEHFLALEEAKA